MSSEELECENHFTANTVRDKAGRFIVKLPLKDNFQNLGDSEQTALNRLYSIERRLSKNAKLEKSYKEFMQEYRDLGHMSEISRDLSSDIPKYYIPHHSVEKPDSATTKLRVVFDAACKSSSNLSLNNVLKSGATVQDDLLSITIRFRKHEFALIGDLEKMYRPILIHPDHRNLQRIVWRNHLNDEVKHFQLNTVTYGTASASFLSTRCLVQIAIDNAEISPTESDIIRSDFYVDDLLTGANDLDSLVKLKTNVCQILSNYGFRLRKIQSNVPKFLEEAEEDSSKDAKYCISDDSSVKTLGISWLPRVDKFEYNAQSVSSDSNQVTKRTILSFVARIFDPLGILGPLSVRAKLIIQNLWQLNIDWDDEIPEFLVSKWSELKHEISQVGLMQIPRHVLVRQPQIIEIHGFADASEQAYACCIFVRSIDSNSKIESHLLCAKSRVSPLKQLSLPRLELMGALLLARLYVKCVKALKLEISRTFLWTDSTVALCWIANEPKCWKTFEANRVAEIQRLTQISDWHNISSQENPADIISRGASLKNLVNSELWLHGPSFLCETDKWPENTNIINFASKKSDIPGIRITHVAQEQTLNDFDIFERFSGLNKLIRVVGYCLRFIHNAKLPSSERLKNNLTTNEIEKSTTVLVKLVQSEHFLNEIQNLKTKSCVLPKSKLKALSPFLDDQGVIRLGGRLRYSNYNYDVKHPIVLPAKHIFTNLVIDYEHNRTFHSGIQCTLAHIGQRYWPVDGRQAVKSRLRRCVTCFKCKPHANVIPKMGELPSARLTPSRPFLSVAIDYAGPFDLKASKLRSNKLIKGYVCVFVCLVTKAVHIEVITDLTSEGFLSLLKRFVSRRGLCSNIYTDNATNFVGCNNELIRVQGLVQNGSFQNYLAHSKIKWHFLPPRSPHFGGLHEAAVKSFKHCLKRVLNGSHLNYEEFYTLAIQIEAILNSRTLIPLSPDPNDLEVITPAHLLIGEQLTSIPERDLMDVKTNHVRRYRHLQQIGQHFWSRWKTEYLNQLQTRNKWQFDRASSFHVGSIVLLRDENTSSMLWPLGRIVQTHPGKDSVIRVVSVKTKNGVVKRAVNKLVLLPIE